MTMHYCLLKNKSKELLILTFPLLILPVLHKKLLLFVVTWSFAKNTILYKDPAWQKPHKQTWAMILILNKGKVDHLCFYQLKSKLLWESTKATTL